MIQRLSFTLTNNLILDDLDLKINIKNFHEKKSDLAGTENNSNKKNVLIVYVKLEIGQTQIRNKFNNKISTL